MEGGGRGVPGSQALRATRLPPAVWDTHSGDPGSLQGEPKPHREATWPTWTSSPAEPSDDSSHVTSCGHRVCDPGENLPAEPHQTAGHSDTLFQAQSFGVRS